MQSILKTLLSTSLILLIAGCEKQPKLEKISGYALGTSYSIQFQTKPSMILNVSEIDDVFETLNRSLSTYIPTSDISRFNHNEGVVIPDIHFQRVFKTSRKIFSETGGYFDPTVGKLVNAFGFGAEPKSKFLDTLVVDSLRQFVGLNKVWINEKLELEKADPNVYVEFNAIAKGYSVDLLANLLKRKGIVNFIIEVGGELVAKGVNPDTKGPWRVAIEDPKSVSYNRSQYIKTLKLFNRAMATSGNYRKTRVDESGRKFVHTLNPKTGWAFSSNILSVSVLANTCMEADGYATAFMAMPLEKSKLLLARHPGLDAFIIFTNDRGELDTFQTSGFEAVLLN